MNKNGLLEELENWFREEEAKVNGLLFALMHKGKEKKAKEVFNLAKKETASL